MSKTLNAIIPFIIVGLILWVVFTTSKVESPPEVLITPSYAVLDEGLTLISGNSALPMSYLPTKKLEVLGDLISIDYCSVGYLKEFWPEHLVYDAEKICYCEGKGNPNCVNHNKKELSCGIFQVNVLAHPEYTCEEMKDPIKNIKAAIEIHKREGWRAWFVCAKVTGVLK